MATEKPQDRQGNFYITMFSMAMITVAAVMSLRNLPGMAAYGWGVIIVLIIACLTFFIPSALVSAELATTYTENGGVYVWVRNAFGPKWGFVAIFMQWAENLPWFPAVLTFVTEALIYAFAPDLANNKILVFVAILVLLWGGTFVNMAGMRASAFLSKSGVITGTILPGAVIIVAGIVYIFAGDHIQIPFQWVGDSGTTFIPDLSDSNDWMLLIGMMVALTGMEMSSVHVLDMKNPKKTFPKSILLSAIIIVALCILGSLAIAFIVPPAQLSLAAGVPEAFDDAFKAMHIEWLTPIICVLMAYGGYAGASTWMIGPSKGVLEVAEEGYLPPWMEYRNKKGMPSHILLVQAIVSSCFCTAVLFMPTVSNAFWVTTALTGQVYMVMYVLMFAAAIKLRYKDPNIERPYRVPWGKPGIWIISGVAFLVSILSIAVGFVPPSNVLSDGIGMIVLYIAFLAVGTFVLILVPIFFYRASLKRNWKELDAIQEAKREGKTLKTDSSSTASTTTTTAKTTAAAGAGATGGAATATLTATSTATQNAKAVEDAMEVLTNATAKEEAVIQEQSKAVKKAISELEAAEADAKAKAARAEAVSQAVRDIEGAQAAEAAAKDAQKTARDQLQKALAEEDAANAAKAKNAKAKGTAKSDASGTDGSDSGKSGDKSSK